MTVTAIITNVPTELIDKMNKELKALAKQNSGRDIEITYDYEIDFRHLDAHAQRVLMQSIAGNYFYQQAHVF